MWDFILDNDATESAQPEFFDVFLKDDHNINFVGRSFLRVFMVKNYPLKVLNDDAAVTFVIQHVTKAGLRSNLQHAAHIDVLFQ